MEANKTIDLEVQDALEVELAGTTVDVLDVTIPVPAIVQGGSNIRVQDTPKENGRDAFSTGGAYVLQQEIEKLANIDIPTKLSDLENDSHFISEDDLISKNFVTESLVGEVLQELSDSILTTVVTEFVSSVQLEQKGYLTRDEVNNVINQKDFVTETELSNKGLATEKFVEDIVGEINEVLDQINGEVI